MISILIRSSIYGKLYCFISHPFYYNNKFIIETQFILYTGSHFYNYLLRTFR